MTFARRARAATTIGVLWGIAWGLLFVLGGAALELLSSPRPQIGGWTLFSILRAFQLPFVIGAVAGFAAGTIFATLLGSFERNSSVEKLSRGRVASWGGLGSALVFVLLRVALNGFAGNLVPLLAVTALFGISGALSAAVTLRAAEERPLIGGGGNARLGAPDSQPEQSL